MMTKRSTEGEMASIAREHYDAVFRFCARRVGMDRAADVSQDTFLTAQKVLHKFRGDSNLTTWLFGIAHNECRRVSRRQKCEPMLLEIDPEQPSDQGSAYAIVDRHALHQALAKLSPEHRDIVILHEIEGLTYDEAAAILCVPVGTVKSRLHHAFLQLRRSLFQAEEAAR
jgi:RNA polymerase sigma-70 factor (ECF subfamily)